MPSPHAGLVSFYFLTRRWRPVRRVLHSRIVRVDTYLCMYFHGSRLFPQRDHAMQAVVRNAWPGPIAVPWLAGMGFPIFVWGLRRELHHPGLQRRPETACENGQCFESSKASSALPRGKTTTRDFGGLLLLLLLLLQSASILARLARLARLCRSARDCRGSASYWLWPVRNTSTRVGTS